eukprot:TRINITY_DN50881_c0_g1_i2.p1 TRINITY_DN50881_c0_g1~~TRINITY_DN50881_c0_g1_i2.p1  ORF type:complete len:647 (-),score=85.55 TRINITY_DN50881_c0_g1_i2:68-2008(-)
MGQSATCDREPSDLPALEVAEEEEEDSEEVPCLFLCSDEPAAKPEFKAAEAELPSAPAPSRWDCQAVRGHGGNFAAGGSSSTDCNPRLRLCDLEEGCGEFDSAGTRRRVDRHFSHLVGWDENSVPPEKTLEFTCTSGDLVRRQVLGEVSDNCVQGMGLPPGVDVAPAEEPQGPPMTIYDSDYVVRRMPLAWGSFGEVYVATHRRTGVLRAVKSISRTSSHRGLGANSAPSKYLKREVQALTTLDHPNIVRLYEVLEGKKSTHLILELCDGGDLCERLNAGPKRLPEKEAAAVLLQIVNAATHMHVHGWIHRDLKPANFMYVDKGDDCSGLIKLIDFGLARTMPLCRQRLAGQGSELTPRLGTVEYMPEEQKEAVSPDGKDRCSRYADRADVWAVGIIMYTMLAGQVPSSRLVELGVEEFLSESLPFSVSEDARDLLKALLQTDPQKRFRMKFISQHRWFRRTGTDPAVGDAPGAHFFADELRKAANSFGRSSVARRLALLAVARESDVRYLETERCFLQSLETHCGGSLCLTSLEEFAQYDHPLSRIAQELFLEFRLLDGTSCGVSEDVCERAFDTLAEGQECICTRRLLRLLGRDDVQLPDVNALFASRRREVSPEVANGAQLDYQAFRKLLLADDFGASALSER